MAKPMRKVVFPVAGLGTPDDLHPMQRRFVEAAGFQCGFCTAGMVTTREFIESARSRGESRLFILTRELLPNVLMIIVVDFSLRVTSAILLSASLAYLGIGVTPPTPAWGLMVRDGQQFIELAWWLPVFPSLAIAVVSVGTVLVGERLRRSIAMPGGDRAR